MLLVNNIYKYFCNRFLSLRPLLILERFRNPNHLNFFFFHKRRRRDKRHNQGCHKNELIQIQKWTGPKV